MKTYSFTHPFVRTTLLTTAILISGCTTLFQAAVFPNQCKRCVVIQAGIEVFEMEGCGASNVRLEERAKIAAYDLSQGSGLCNYTVSCTTWKQEPATP